MRGPAAAAFLRLPPLQPDRDVFASLDAHVRESGPHDGRERGRAGAPKLHTFFVLRPGWSLCFVVSVRATSVPSVPL